MTDLISRPSSRRPGVRGDASRSGGPTRPLTVSAALAAATAVGAGLLGCMALAVIGWFLADGGAHGDSTDALGVGAVVWVHGLGAQVQWGSVQIAMMPLGLTAVLGWVLYRCARWAGRTSAPPESDRALALGLGVFVAVHLCLALVIAVLGSRDPLQADLLTTILGSVVLALVAGAPGLLVGSGRLHVSQDRLPGWVRAVASGSLRAVVLVLAVSAALVLVSLVWHLNRIDTVVAGLRLERGDTAMLSLLNLTYLPNAVGWAASWVLGPGFALGAGTSISPSGAVLGPVPALPLFAAVPHSTPPSWAMAVLAVPVLAAALGAGRAQRRYTVPAWDSAALRALATGFGGALLLTVVAALSRGSLGEGELADLGPPVGEVFVAATLAMGVGGLLGGLVVTFVQRRRTTPSDPADPL